MDPTVTTSARHLEVLDSQFCRRRLQNAAGYLIARQNSSGNWQLYFTTEPVVPLSDVTAIEDQTFGQFIVQGSDNIMRTLTPPNTANLALLTDGNGNVVFAQLPVATVPDPLTVADLTVTNLATIAAAAISALSLPSIGSGTLSSILGLDGSGNVITGTPATTGAQTVMFFEAATSPSPTFPNQAVTAGNLLTIGNLLSDSVLPAVPGGSLITATNIQTLTVLEAGWYNIWWGGQVEGSNGSPSINLLINSINVNSGNATILGPVVTTGRSANLSGFEGRRLAAGTTIQLQLGSQSGASIATYNVRLMAQRTGA